jgi:exosortase
MTARSSSFGPFDELPRLARLNIVLLAVAAVALSVRLWPDWAHNPDLSHGFFMPIIFAVLVHESRLGAAHFLRPSGAVRLAFITLLALALGAMIAAGLYAAAVDWSHPLVNYMLTAALVFFLGAGVCVFAGTRLRYVGCNWNIFVAIVLWMLCTPIPPGTYTRLTIALQLWVSEGVLRTLHILGIPAIRHGNIIELVRTTVGVEEACSGVRSLISCVFAGLFFSATFVRRPWARAVIILLSAPLALIMNFVRSLTLTLLSNQGVDISGTWHDLTGFAVLGVTAVLLGGLAFALGRASDTPRVETEAEEPPRSHTPYAQLIVLTCTLGLAAALVFVSVANTRPSVRRDSPAPDLEALLPKTAAGWQVTTSTDLYQFQNTLQTDHLLQRSYRKPGPKGTMEEVILYVAYWHAGQAPVSLVASHTPDACWPGSGWTSKSVDSPRVQLEVDHRVLASAEYRLFTFGDFPQHVWFWHLYDGAPITYRDPYSPIALLRIAWQYGLRHEGDQLFVRVSSTRPWPELAHEPLLEDFFHRIQPLGL